MSAAACRGEDCMGCTVCLPEGAASRSASINEDISDHRIGKRKHKPSKRLVASQGLASTSESPASFEKQRRRKRSSKTNLGAGQADESKKDGMAGEPKQKKKRGSDHLASSSNSRPLTSTGIGPSVPNLEMDQEINDVFSNNEEEGAGPLVMVASLQHTLESPTSSPKSFQDLPDIAGLEVAVEHSALLPAAAGGAGAPVRTSQADTPPLSPDSDAPPALIPTSDSTGSTTPTHPPAPATSPNNADPSESNQTNDSRFSVPGGEREKKSTSSESGSSVFPGISSLVRERGADHVLGGWIGVGTYKSPPPEPLDWSYCKRATPDWNQYRLAHPLLPIPPPHKVNEKLTVADWNPLHFIEIFTQWQEAFLPDEVVGVRQEYFRQVTSVREGAAGKWLTWCSEMEEPRKVTTLDLLMSRRHGVDKDSFDQLVADWIMYKNWKAGETVTNTVFSGPKLSGIDRFYHQHHKDSNGRDNYNIFCIKLGLQFDKDPQIARVAVESSGTDGENESWQKCPGESGPVKCSPVGGGRLLASPAGRGSWVAEYGGGRTRRGARHGKVLKKSLYVSDGFSEISPDNLSTDSGDDRMYWQAAKMREERVRSRSSGAGHKACRVVPWVSNEEGDQYRPLHPIAHPDLLLVPRKGNVAPGLSPLPGKIIPPRRRLVYQDSGSPVAASDVQQSGDLDEVDGGRTRDKPVKAGAEELAEIDEDGAVGGDVHEVSEISKAARALSISSTKKRREQSKLGAISKTSGPKPTVKFSLTGGSNSQFPEKKEKRGGTKLLLESQTKRSKAAEDQTKAVVLPVLQNAKPWAALDYREENWVKAVEEDLARTIADHSPLLQLLETMAWSFEGWSADSEYQLSRLCASFCGLVILLQEAKEEDMRLQRVDSVDISPLLTTCLSFVQYEQMVVSKLKLNQDKYQKGSHDHPDLLWFETEEGRTLHAISLSLTDAKLDARLRCLHKGLQTAFLLVWRKAERMEWPGDSQLRQRLLMSISGLEQIRSFFGDRSDAFTFLVYFYMIRAKDSNRAPFDDTNIELMEVGNETFGTKVKPIRSHPWQLDSRRNFSLAKRRLLMKIKEQGSEISSLAGEAQGMVDHLRQMLEQAENRHSILLGEENALMNSSQDVEGCRSILAEFSEEVLAARRKYFVPSKLPDWTSQLASLEEYLESLRGVRLWRPTVLIETSSEEENGGGDQTDGKYLSRPAPAREETEPLLEDNGGYDSEDLQAEDKEQVVVEKLPAISSVELNAQWTGQDSPVSTSSPRQSVASFPTSPPTRQANLLDSGLSPPAKRPISMQPDRSPAVVSELQQYNAEVWQKTRVGTYSRTLAGHMLQEVWRDRDSECDLPNTQTTDRAPGQQ